MAIKPAAGRIESLPLQADGGGRPLRWLVNGRPIPTALLGRGASWAPDGPGHVSIVVVDAEGRAANATVWID